MNHVTCSNSKGQRLSARTCGPQGVFFPLFFWFAFCSAYRTTARPCSLNDKWSQEILRRAGFCPAVAVKSLSLCAPSVYFRRLTWVIAKMEEHLGRQQGFSGGERQKGYLWEHSGTQRDSWFMGKAKRCKQQKSFVKSRSWLSDFSSFFVFGCGLQFIFSQQR